jgi:hypothetical protein
LSMKAAALEADASDDISLAANTVAVARTQDIVRR